VQRSSHKFAHHLHQMGMLTTLLALVQMPRKRVGTLPQEWVLLHQG
jgi:hypothetical protein